jgi:hypothetical protein
MIVLGIDVGNSGAVALLEESAPRSSRLRPKGDPSSQSTRILSTLRRALADRPLRAAL